MGRSLGLASLCSAVPGTIHIQSATAFEVKWSQVKSIEYDAAYDSWGRIARLNGAFGLFADGAVERTDLTVRLSFIQASSGARFLEG